MRFDEIRDAVVREWLELPPDRRRSQSQAMDFAKEVARGFPVDLTGDPTSLIVRWLVPHLGKEKNQ